MWLLLFAVGLAVSVGRAQSEDDRIAQIKDQIQALDRVVAATKAPDEKSRLEVKLQRMQQELGILQQRQAIEIRERALQDTSVHSAVDLLRDKLRVVDRTQEESEKRVHDIITQRQRVSGERETLAAQLEDLRSQKEPDSGRVSDLEERIFTKNEELRELALQREAAEAESDLARDADRLRDELKSSETASRPSVRLLFESYTRLRAQEKSGDQVNALSADLVQNLKLSESALDLLRQKLAKFDEEMAVLEKQTNFFHRDAKVEQFLASEKSQKQSLLDRLPFAIAEVDAIKRAQAAVNARQELNLLGLKAQQEQFAMLKDAYVRRVRWPAGAFTLLLALHLLVAYLILPLFYKHEGLFLARRLARYAFMLAVVAVLAGFFFDDLSMVAATLGIVSAALVISLQDVCTSICGWFVIIGGSKFRIGDRLEIDGTRGDILDIQLLRTLMLEVGGWLGVDQPTGRVILVPNNVIFKTKIFNYSHGHPYIWGKIDITITLATPLTQARELFLHVLEQENRETLNEAKQAAAVMQRRYGIDDAGYEPKIYTAIAASGILFTLFYVSHYRRFSATRVRIVQRVLAELATRPEIQLAYPSISIFRGDPEIKA